MVAKNDSILIVKNLCKSFGAEKVLDGLQFTVGRNDFTILLGPNGCGKTTLVRLLAGVISPDGGTIELVENAQGVKPRTSFVFQKPLLLPWLTVEENIVLAGQFLPSNRDASDDYLEGLLKRAGLLELRGRYPSKLSGGQRQKVALLRALITKPDLIVMDEPFSSLDDETREDLQDYLVQPQAEEHLTILFVTHDLFEATLLGDKVVVLSRRPATVVHELSIATQKPERRSADLDSYVLQLRGVLRRKACCSQG